VQYTNPLTVEIISDAGFAMMTSTLLLRLIRDWSSTRRQSAAAASNAESQAFLQTELRRLVLKQVSEGELPLTVDAVSALLSDSMVDAVDRLAANKLTMQRQENPFEIKFPRLGEPKDL
jgi:hypothetical protein